MSKTVAIEFRGLLRDESSRAGKRKPCAHFSLIPILDLDTGCFAGFAFLSQYWNVGGATRQIDAFLALKNAINLQFGNQAFDGIDTVVAKTVGVLGVGLAISLRQCNERCVNFILKKRGAGTRAPAANVALIEHNDVESHVG